MRIVILFNLFSTIVPRQLFQQTLQNGKKQRYAFTKFDSAVHLGLDVLFFDFSTKILVVKPRSASTSLIQETKPS